MSSLNLGQKPTKQVSPEECQCSCHSLGGNHCACCSCGGMFFHEFLSEDGQLLDVVHDDKLIQGDRFIPDEA